MRSNSYKAAADSVTQCIAFIIVNVFDVTNISALAYVTCGIASVIVSMIYVTNEVTSGDVTILIAG